MHHSGSIRFFLFALLSSLSLVTTAAEPAHHSLAANPLESAENGPFDLRHYGHFEKMVHRRNSAGVVRLKKALSAANGYAVGAISGGRGEITVINGRVWLDYGEDGLGNSVSEVGEESAVLLVTSSVAEWHEVSIPEAMSLDQLQLFILAQAERINLNIRDPFPFLLSGNFPSLELHVINGENPAFSGHGSGHFYQMHQTSRENQSAQLVGFYSADKQGVYTHPGDSWHLHAVLADEQAGAHVDKLSVNRGVVLMLPKISGGD